MTNLNTQETSAGSDQEQVRSKLPETQTRQIDAKEVNINDLPLTDFSLEAITTYLQDNQRTIYKETNGSWTETPTFFIRIDRDLLTTEEIQFLIQALQQFAEPKKTITNPNLTDDNFTPTTTNLPVFQIVLKPSLLSQLSSVIRTWELSDLAQQIKLIRED